MGSSAVVNPACRGAVGPILLNLTVPAQDDVTRPEIHVVLNWYTELLERVPVN